MFTSFKTGVEQVQEQPQRFQAPKAKRRLLEVTFYASRPHSGAAECQSHLFLRFRWTSSQARHEDKQGVGKGAQDRQDKASDDARIQHLEAQVKVLWA